MNIYAVDEHLKYFQFLAIYKQRCPENFPTGLWWHIYTILFYANLGMKLLVKGICVFNFRKCCKTIFIEISSHLPSYQHIMRVPVSESSTALVIFNCFKKSAMSSEYVMISYGILICILLITNKVEFLLIYLFAISIFSYVNCLLKYSNLFLFLFFPFFASFLLFY